ncbi:hypothetical protein AARAC_002425 [Aspergillus arachidicola]|uniref:Uncharacterized protein n=2 Tax=Aspergillus arachidicola TaxID=656916 RepID=A0A2G7FW91_9EURO|nr:hypothetical protein AARAC_002425 [Aspergillus arachidicola]
MEKIQTMDQQSTLGDTMILSQGLPDFLPAAIRRHIPRLYPSLHRAAQSDSNINTARAGHKPTDHSFSPSLSEPELTLYGQKSDLASGHLQRPATAGSSSNDQDSCGSSVSGKSSETSYITTFEEKKGVESMGFGMSKYEEESGLRWNHVVPAFQFLQHAGVEAQRRDCDSHLVRSLYMDALCYLLQALPTDLTYEETARIRKNLPGPVSNSLAVPSTAGFVNQPVHTRHPAERSYLHRLLASSIVHLFLLLQFLMPYLKIVLHRLYQFERSHRVTERVVSASLDAADSLGKRSVSLGTTVLSLHDGKVGVAVSSLAAWWVEGIAGGIYEGIGEGMTILGFIRPNPGVFTMDSDNDDAIQPTKERFDRVLRESYALWSSYVDLEGPTSLPFECIDLKRILGQTPSFLGHGLIPENEPAPFKCTESTGTLYVNGRSTWKTSKGACQLGPKEIHRTLLLATQNAMNVELSDSAPFAEWPGVRGLEGYDEGNYIAVLFLAWAYILSARWSELLSISPEHRCMIIFKKETSRCEPPLSHTTVQVDIGDDASDDEVHWWNAILSAYEGRGIATSGTTVLRAKLPPNVEVNRLRQIGLWSI